MSDDLIGSYEYYYNTAKNSDDLIAAYEKSQAHSQLELKRVLEQMEADEDRRICRELTEIIDVL